MTDDFDVPPEWHCNFFTAPVNLFWEKMVPEEATRADLAFLSRHLGVAPPARLLDMPCGAGRHALALARLGYTVHGVDISADAVARASAAAREPRLPARFECADMRFFEAEEPFDAAICLGNSLGYFDKDGTLAFFASLVSSLRPGAWLVLDTYCCAESIFPLQEEREIAFDGGSYLSEYRYDAMRSVLKTKAELRLGEEVHSLLYAHRITTSGELVGLLRATGFDIEGLYGGVDDAPYRPGSPRLLLVASRAAQPERSSSTAASRSMR